MSNCVRKRKSAASEASVDNTSTGKRPCVNGAGDVGSVATHDNTDEDCVDDKQLVRNTMIVRLPTQAPNAQPNSVIVIDDSDDDTGAPKSPSDIKPDVRQLDQQLVESSASNVDRDHKPPTPYSMIAQQTNHIAPEHTASECSPPECTHQMSIQNVAGAGIGSTQASSYSRSSTETSERSRQMQGVAGAGIGSSQASSYSCSSTETSERSRQMLGQDVAGAGVGSSQAISASHNNVENGRNAGIGDSQACSASRRTVENTPMSVKSVGGARGRNAQASTSSHGAVVSIQTPETGTGSGNLQACSSSHNAVEDVGGHSTLSRPQRRLSLSKSTYSATLAQNQKDAEKSSSEKSVASSHLQTKSSRQDVSIQTEACSSSAECQLESLRSNVLQLLKTIVPTLTCGNLQFVDELVVEMVRVNAENSELDN